MAANKFMVGGKGSGKLVIVALPRYGELTREEALNLASWLVAMAYVETVVPVPVDTLLEGFCSLVRENLES